MATVMNLDPVDFFPGYDPYTCLARRRSAQESYSCFWSNLIAVILSVAICAAGLYYYEVAGREVVENLKSPKMSVQENCVNSRCLIDIKKELNMLKNKMDKTEMWRKMDKLYSKIYIEQEFSVEQKIKEALNIYDSDKIGMFDYAAVYASGSIISTPDTLPYPINRTISFFSLLKINVLSNPENLIQPNNLPGNCFAFYGDKGRIRIKLGKTIAIQAVTVDHVKMYEDNTSAPREFKVYGLLTPNEKSGILLGKFTYNVKGRTYQTFKVSVNESGPFEYVELEVLNNHGKEDFTCVYRFRVHDHYIDT